MSCMVKQWLSMTCSLVNPWLSMTYPGISIYCRHGKDVAVVDGVLVHCDGIGGLDEHRGIVVSEHGDYHCGRVGGSPRRRPQITSSDGQLQC